MAYKEAIEAHYLVDIKTKIKWATKITLKKYPKNIIKTLLKLLTFQNN
jgi:hypothetical protein